jgi:hypothetical protein
MSLAISSSERELVALTLADEQELIPTGAMKSNPPRKNY